VGHRAKPHRRRVEAFYFHPQQETPMKSTLALAAVLCVMLGAAANAGKYTCSFQKDGNEVKSCSIEPNKPCTYSYGGNLIGACGTAEDNGDLLACAFGAQNITLAEILRGGRPAAATRSRVPSGMVALGVTFASTNSAVLIEGYREKQGDPDHAVVCFH